MTAPERDKAVEEAVRNVEWACLWGSREQRHEAAGALYDLAYAAGRREGAEEMREAAAREAGDTDIEEASGATGTYYAQLGDAAATRRAIAAAIKALPLPEEKGDTRG